MLTAIKVTSINASETEKLFKNKVKFLVNEKGDPEEIMFFNDSGHAALKVQIGNYGSLKVDHVAFKDSQLSPVTENRNATDIDMHHCGGN